MRVVCLEGAEQDLRDLDRYVVQSFGAQAWQESYAKVKKSVRALQAFPLRGSIPTELLELGMPHYGQVISGMNRILYEVRQDIVCDNRRDMRTLLSRRLLRTAP